MHSATRLLLCLALALPALAAADPAAPRLHLTASPEALRLAEGGRATLRIAGASEPPAMAASAGHVEGLHEVSSGVYEADYVPPESLDPQIAFVTALADGHLGWLPIPLSGVRDVTVAAPRGTQVKVTVQDEAFGPVPAGNLGRAVVRVVVPPGVRTGRVGAQKVDLGVGDFRLVHLLATSASVDANLGGEVTLLAFVVDERGRPRADAPLALVVSEGELSRVTPVEPGVYQARWRLAKGAIGQARATARLRDRPALEATAEVERAPGPPVRISIDLDQERLVAGQGDELGVVAHTLDQAGNPTEAPTRLLADLGEVLEWERAGRGRYEGRVQVPPRRGGRQQLELKVVASPSLAATRLVPLVAGAIEQVELEAEGGLFADDRPHELRLLVLDREGNRVEPAEAPVVVPSRGAVGAPARVAAGVYRLTYRAPLSRDGFEEVLATRVGAFSQTTKLRVQAIGGGVTLGVKAGLAVGSGRLRSPSGGVDLGFWTGALGPSLGLLLEGQVHALHRTDAVTGADLKIDSTFLSLGASVAWRGPLQSGLLWLAGGGGAVAASSRVSGIAGQGASSGTAWVPEVHGSAGWGRRLGPGIPFGELRLAWQGSASEGPVRGSLRSLTLQVGYRFDVL